MSKHKEFWITKGISCSVDDLAYDEYKNRYLKYLPDDFYDLVSPNDTIKDGIHVIEYSAYEKLQATLNKLTMSLNSVLNDTDWKYEFENCSERYRLLKEDYRTLEAKYKTMIEATHLLRVAMSLLNDELDAELGR